MSENIERSFSELFKVERKDSDKPDDNKKKKGNKTLWDSSTIKKWVTIFKRSDS